MPTNRKHVSLSSKKIYEVPLFAQNYIITEFFLLENLVGKFVHIGLSSKSILTVYNRITYAVVQIK